MADYDLHQRVVDVVGAAGGQLVGRTRLQKVVCLDELAGFDHAFEFEYRHYGPYSEELTEATQVATGLGLIEEDARQTARGISYSIFKLNKGQARPLDGDRTRFIAAAAQIDAVDLELAATAAFLFVEGVQDPWGETARRKPEKAARIANAQAAYARLRELPTPKELPAI